MYVEAGQLHFYFNGYGETTRLPPVSLSGGRQEAVLEFEALGDRRGRGRITLDGWRSMVGHSSRRHSTPG